MIVVADTTPLNYLVQIDEVQILPHLFGSVLIPVGVIQELRADGAQAMVCSWANDLPARVVVAEAHAFVLNSLPKLGRGESEAIAVALSLGADIAVIDDGPARRLAKARGLAVAGTLGLLKEAADEGLLDFRRSVERMRELGF